MKRALVTGAAGFIGSHVADHCKNLGMHVTGVDDLSGGFMRNARSCDVFGRGDIRDRDFVRALWGEGRHYDFVYHLAAYAAEGLSHFIRHYNYTTNLVGSTNLITESVNHGVECFVFASSIAVYGKGQLPMREEMVPRPEDPYGISKYAVELDLAAAHEMFKMPYLIMRPHNVYGPRQNISDRYRNVIGIFMSQALRGEPLTIFGDGLQTRAFTYIDDVAPLMAESPLHQAAIGQVFNVGYDEYSTVLEVAHLVGESLGVPIKREHLSARNEVVEAFSSHAKVMRVFGDSARAKTGLREGIGKMAEWVRAQGELPTPTTFSEIEIQKNLPSAWRR